MTKDGPDAPGASTLLRGGVVATPGLPAAEAMLTRGDRIVWVGTDDAAASLMDDVDEVIQLENRLVTPVFVDAHVHTSGTGHALAGVDLSSARSPEHALDLIHAQAQQRPGRPLFAHGWDENDWSESRPFTATELDNAGGGAHVYAIRVDGHSAVVSSGLLDTAEARSAIGSDGTGLVVRDAHHRIRDAFRDGVSAGDRRHHIDTALRSAAAVGIGAVHEVGAPTLTSREDLQDVRAAGERDDSPDVIAYWGELVATEEEARALADLLGVRGLAGDLNVDGSIGSRTAAIREPYADAPDVRGYGYLSVDQVEQHVTACTFAGLQAGFHVIGDAGMDAVVEGMRRSAKTVGTQRFTASRHRLEHVEMCHPEHIATLAELGVVASVQPAFDASWGGVSGMYAARLGAARALAANPYADLHQAGVQLALGSDTPVTPFAPWQAVRACVRHHNASQRLTVEQALDLHTRGGWAAAGDDENGQGLLPGARASYVIWDRRGGLPTLEIGAEVPVAQRTVVGGRVIHDLA